VWISKSSWIIGVDLDRRIKLLALDVDGTLASEGNEVTSATRKALHQVLQTGIVVALCTGRRFRNASYIFKSLGRSLYSVCLGGSIVKDPNGNTLQAMNYSGKDFLKVAGTVQASGQTVVAQCDLPGIDFFIDGSRPWNRETSRYYEMNHSFAHWSSNITEEVTVDVLAIGSFGDPEEMSLLADRINAQFPREFTVHVMKSVGPNSSYCEILPVGIDKWAGLTALAGILGIADDEICAVGDELNDFEMVKNAGLGLAMRNARPELKEIADRVVGRNDEDGLVPFLEELAAAGPGGAC